MPAATAHEVAPIGSSASAERFSFPVVPMSSNDEPPATPSDESS